MGSGIAESHDSFKLRAMTSSPWSFHCEEKMSSLHSIFASFDPFQEVENNEMRHDDKIIDIIAQLGKSLLKRTFSSPIPWLVRDQIFRTINIISNMAMSRKGLQSDTLGMTEVFSEALYQDLTNDGSSLPLSVASGLRRYGKHKDGKQPYEYI